ncbi:hypothetical protein KAS08_04045 [Candidatus Pacearchaeota archaeon]|nr:hypothetical protein [Candidatus Pacearchaeota archaeon]
MKKVGQGLQFNVYLKDGKIFKKPTSKFQMILTLVSWSPLLLFQIKKLKKEISQATNLRNIAITNLKKIDYDKKILANLVFNENSIGQDKVIPLEQIINKDYDKSKIIIENFIKLIFECWKNGFSDKIFNLTINNGITDSGEIVLMDFGEMTFKKSDVEQDIEEKRWERSRDFKTRLRKDIKSYYKKRMIEEMTILNLNKYWKSKK